MSTLSHFKKSASHWWLYALLGVLLIIVGIMALDHRFLTLQVLSVLLALTFIVGGVMEIGISFMGGSDWGWELILGALSLWLGIMLLMSPDVTFAILPFYVALLLLFRSIYGMTFAWELKDAGQSWGVLFTLSLIVCLFAIYSFFQPVAADTFAWIYVGIAIILLGIMTIAGAFELRKFTKAISK